MTWASQRQRWAVGARGPLRPPVASVAIAESGPAVVETAVAEAAPAGAPDQCRCGAHKSDGRPFCLNCYLSMPAEVKLAIRRGDVARGTDWLETRLARDREWARRYRA